MRNDDDEPTLRSRYDWIKLKREFFDSPHLQALVFLRSKGIPESSAKRRSKGWSAEKRALSGISANEAILRSAQNSIASDLEFQYLCNKLKLAKHKLLSRVAELLDEDFTLKDARNVEIVWRIIKVELGEPIVISHNSNDNLHEGSEDLKAFLAAIKAKPKECTEST